MVFNGVKFHYKVLFKINQLSPVNRIQTSIFCLHGSYICLQGICTAIPSLGGSYLNQAGPPSSSMMPKQRSSDAAVWFFRI